MDHQIEGRKFQFQGKLDALELIGILKDIVNEIEDDLQEKLSENDPLGLSQVAMAKMIYNMRRYRDRVFGQKDLFSDPSWDILLDLYIAKSEKKRISVTSACLGSAVPSTTALRWLKILEDRRLVERTTDPEDGRRHFVSISRQGSDLLSEILSFR